MTVQQFKDLGFKLLVVDQLMYVDETLRPKFDLAEVLQREGITGDLWNWAHDNGHYDRIVPQAREYFESLVIDGELLATVVEVEIEGGADIYFQCSPTWDGEGDVFDVASLADLALVPNLRSFGNSDLLAPPLRAQLAAHGVTAD